MVILGIDPGTATTGYGVIETSAKTVKIVEYGCITTKKNLSDADRLLEIHRDLTKIIKKHRPQKVVVESVFFYNNVKTAITVAQSRGVILLTLKQHNLNVIEMTPLQIKQSITGYGKADKKQIQYMVKQLLNLKRIPKPDDAADALAAAISATNQSF